MYIPYSQRNKQKAAGYVPVSQRSLVKPKIEQTGPKKYNPEQVEKLRQSANTSYKGGFGDALKFIPELPAAATRIAVDFATSGVALGKTGVDYYKNKLGVQDINISKPAEETSFPKSRAGVALTETLYGKPEVRIPNIPRYGQQFTEAFGVKSENNLVNFAVGGVLAALDFTTGGGSTKVIKTLSRLGKVEDVVGTLRKINVAEDLITEYAPIIAKTKNEAEISKIVSHIENLQKTTSRTKPLVQTERAVADLESHLFRNESTRVDWKNIENLNIKPTKPVTLYRDGNIETSRASSWSYDPKISKNPISRTFTPDEIILDTTNSGFKQFTKDNFSDISQESIKKFKSLENEVIVKPVAEVKLPELPKFDAIVPSPKAIPKPKTTLTQKIDQADSSLQKLGFQKENIGAKFDSATLENQYQEFKKLVTPKKLDTIEDAVMLKNKLKDKIEMSKIDNILYSQEIKESDVFDMFKDRRYRETEERGLKGKIAVEEKTIKRNLTKLERQNKIRTDKQKALDRVKALYDARVAKIKDAKEILQSRRSFIKAVQKHFGLSDNDLKSITQRDIRLMDNLEFKKHLDNIRIKSEQLATRRQALNELQDTIQTKELKKVENIQQALKLPKIKDMSTGQLKELNETLEQFKTGDEFLSVRKLETVDNTDLKGIKTLREAKEALAKELKVPLSELDNIKVGTLDRFRYDTALAEKNPFYGLMVDTVNKSVLNAEARYLTTEKKINSLVNKSRKGTQTIVGRFVPQDKKIFDWLSASDKSTVQLSDSELEAAQYIQKRYAEMRDYLVQHNTLRKYREDYITHIQRGFLEEWKEDGLISAFKGIFKNYSKEEAIFNIMDDTGKILPLEKFFQFSMRRTGQVEPTKNVASAFLSYLKAFEKKAALDSIVPKLDIYAHSLTPKTMTPRGLEFDRSLKTFINEWINTKKGRTAKIVGVEQGGKIDLLLRAGKAFTSMLDLGLNIPVGIAARGGENMTNFVQMGARNYTLGLARARTAQGKVIAERYKNFIGRTPFDELSDASKGLGDKLMDGAFGLFKDATVRSNKTFLLGSLTPEEFKLGQIADSRLAEMKREMGRYRVVEGAKSIVGSTSVGGILTQYKSWAIPPLRTTLDNVVKLTKNPKLIRSREGQELLRGALGTLAVVFTVKAFVGDEKDKGFIGTVIDKAYRDAMTLVGALDPKTITSEPRLISFIGDLGEALSDLIKLEGADKVVNTLNPRLIKQFIPKKKTTTKKGGTTPELPELPKLPKLPGI